MQARSATHLDDSNICIVHTVMVWFELSGERKQRLGDIEMNVIAFHRTVDQWAVAITKEGKTYHVNRVSPGNHCLRLFSTRDIEAAKDKANIIWLRDRQK
jgi:hypothetical protein